MLGEKIRMLRLKSGLSIKETAPKLGIDASLLSRIERDERMPSEEMLREMAAIFSVSADDLLKTWLADKVSSVLQAYPNFAEDVLQAMETRIAYLSGAHAMKTQQIEPKMAHALQKLDALRANWQARMPKNATQKRRLNESFGIEYTYESNKIEGSTLTLQETYLVINDGLTIAGKSVREHLEAINHDEAIEFVRELASNKLPITEYRLKQLHHLILKGIDRENAGAYRSVPVRISGSKHVPPEPYLVPKLMEEFFAFYKAEKNRMHPVLLAAEMHERLVTIHPFIDGNGRTARLLMNLILLQNGYTIAILKGDNASRMAYYAALEKVQADADTAPFYDLVIGAVAQSLEEHLKFT